MHLNPAACQPTTYRVLGSVVEAVKKKGSLYFVTQLSVQNWAFEFLAHTAEAFSYPSFASPFHRSLGIQLDLMFPHVCSSCMWPPALVRFLDFNGLALCSPAVLWPVAYSLLVTEDLGAVL